MHKTGNYLIMDPNYSSISQLQISSRKYGGWPCGYAWLISVIAALGLTQPPIQWILGYLSLGGGKLAEAWSWPLTSI